MVGYHDEENQPLMTDTDQHDDGSGRNVEATANAAAPTTPAVPDADGRGGVDPRGAQDDDNSRNRNERRDESHPDAPPGSSTSPGDSECAASPNGPRRSLEVEDQSSGVSTPRFMQDENSWKRWRWVPYPVRRVLKGIVYWSYGPASPQPYRIKPLFPVVQEYPLFLVERFLPKRKQRFWVLFLSLSIWLVVFVLVKHAGTTATDVAGWGQPVDISCGLSYWGPDNSCGVDGNDCRPFTESGFPFRCSAHCESYHILNPRPVGDTEINYRPFVIGGPGSGAGDGETIYRGDSYICGAAIHAGIVNNANGGCGVVRLRGYQANYTSSARNGITSIGFDSYFPLAYEFVDDIRCSASDNRWPLLGVSATLTALISLFTSSPAIFFFPVFTGIFWTTGVALDPPPSANVTELFSKLLGKFLPAMFVAWVMYDKMGVRRTLKGLTAQVEKTLLWLGPCWVGAMDNYTLSFIPINRLNAHDIEQQPGAKAALAIIIILLVVIILVQIFFFRQEGRFIRHLKLYGLLVASILISLLLPGLNLRIHHYILALLLLPGTSIQTRASLLYQGLLIGLFINGIARWGFHPVLQTPDALRGDAQLGSELPMIPAPTIDLATADGGWSNITFMWEPPREAQWDGISIIVNDVERFRAFFDDRVDASDSFVWRRNSTLHLPEYFRFGFMDGSNTGDYTKAGVWTADGEWERMASGPSRVKARDMGAPLDKIPKRR